MPRQMALLCLCVAALGAGEALPVPGWPQPQVWPDPAPRAWMHELGELTALAPDGAMRWRRELAPGARLWPGAGGVLLADDSGLRWLDADGDERRLPPLPSDILPLGVDGDVAFFAQDAVGWRLDVTPAQIVLPDRPLGVPLAAGPTSLWLTLHHLVWCDGQRTVARRHGLPVGRGWSLARDRQGAVVIVSPDRRAWSVGPHQPGADDERLGLPVATPAEADRATRLRHALIRRDWETAASLAVGTAERAALALYAGSPPPPGAEDLAPLPRDPGELSLPEPAWSSAVAPRARPSARPAVPARRQARPLVEDAEPCPAEVPPPLRTGDGLVVGVRSWLVEDDGERARAMCHDDGRLRWYVRWLSPSSATVPARSLTLADGRLLIAEGDARLLVLDADDGATILDVRPRRLPLLPARTWLRPGGAVVLFPPGRDDRLGWLHADGGERGEREEFLPAPARWLLVLPDGEVWLSLRDGRTLAGDAPGAWRPLVLPAALAEAPSARLVEGGVAAGTLRWRWRE